MRHQQCRLFFIKMICSVWYCFFYQHYTSRVLQFRGRYQFSVSCQKKQCRRCMGAGKWRYRRIACEKWRKMKEIQTKTLFIPYFNECTFNNCISTAHLANFFLSNHWFCFGGSDLYQRLSFCKEYLNQVLIPLECYSFKTARDNRILYSSTIIRTAWTVWKLFITALPDSCLQANTVLTSPL